MEFTPHRNLIHNFKLDNTQKQNNEEYDIIIGWAILRELVIDFTFSTSIPSMLGMKSVSQSTQKGLGQKKNWPTFSTCIIWSRQKQNSIDTLISFLVPTKKLTYIHASRSISLQKNKKISSVFWKFMRTWRRETWAAARWTLFHQTNAQCRTSSC